MISTRTVELKNKLIKVQEQCLKDTQNLLETSILHTEWAMDTQKKYMHQSQTIWHLEWQIRWLERKLRALKPNIELYEDSTETRDETYGVKHSAKFKKKKLNGVFNVKK